MNEEQKNLMERILALYKKFNVDYFEYYIDEQEFQEDWERMWKNCPKAILNYYQENYDEWHDDFIDGCVSREEMLEPLHLLRELKKYVEDHPVDKNGSSKNLEDRSEIR